MAYRNYGRGACKTENSKVHSTAAELMEIYAMYERALLYDWALFKGKFSLTERSDKLLATCTDRHL